MGHGAEGERSGYDAKVLLDSANLCGDRLTTFEITFPRFILAEFNTHRALSRSSASSRAIPIEKMLARVASVPAGPLRWGKNGKGMSDHGPLDDALRREAREIWDRAAADAHYHAKQLANRGVHKQLVNRLLEPFLMHTVIVSATDWANFFALRTDAGAQPEMREIACMMADRYVFSEPQRLLYGDWHMPLLLDDERGTIRTDVLTKVSAARCARVSYLTHDGVRNVEKDLELYAKLVENSPRHASPTEHVALALDRSDRFGNFTGWKQLRKFIDGENVAEFEWKGHRIAP